MTVIEERSRSRTGKHKRRCLYFVVDSSCNEIAPQIVSKEEAKGLYAEGESTVLIVRIPVNSFLITLDFRINQRGHIRGNFSVFDSEGNIIGKGVYRKLKVRVTEAVNEEVLDIIKCVFRKLKLPVKRYGIIRGAIKG